MAKLYVTEYTGTGDIAERGAFPKEPEIATQVVTFTTTTQSTAFNPSTSLVRIHTDAICSVAFGTNPTATTSSRRMTAGQTEYFKVPSAKSYMVAAVTNT